MGEDNEKDILSFIGVERKKDVNNKINVIKMPPNLQKGGKNW